VSVSYNTSQLGPGDHHAVIRVHGGAGGPVTIPVTLHLLPPAQVWEPFNYYDGTLAGSGGADWQGAAAAELSIDAGALKISGGTGVLTARRAATAAGAGGTIAAEVSIRGGSGSGDIYWNIYLDDAAGNNFARWYGSSRHVRGRVGEQITAPDMLLTGGWDDLYVEINTAANTSEFFFNGSSFGTISHGTAPANAIATVRIDRSDRPTAAADAVYFDDLHVGAVDVRLPHLEFTRHAGELLLAWPAVRRAAALESTGDPATSWSAPAPAFSGGRFMHSEAIVPPRRFFRLRRR
jgi:hypothetical protein